MKETLKSGASTNLKIDYWYNINNRKEIGGRSGYEYFEEEDNYLYTIAQFYPRMCVYNEVEGWQNKQFLGRGEFTLPFGDYSVNITVPDDNIVASTGSLQNASEVLTQEQYDRIEKAKTADRPVMIINQKEAEKAEKGKQLEEYAEYVKALSATFALPFGGDISRLTQLTFTPMDSKTGHNGPFKLNVSRSAIAENLQFINNVCQFTATIERVPYTVTITRVIRG